MRIAEVISCIVLLVTIVDGCMRVTPTTPGIPAVPCKACAENLITVNKKGSTPTAQDMASDKISTTGSCAERTFKCEGFGSSIEMWNETESVGIINDGDTGTVTTVLTCNEAGTAWVYKGLTIIEVECSYPPVCTLCLPPLEPGFEDEAIPPQTDYSSGCEVRKYTCTGKDASIEVANVLAEDVKTIGDGGTGIATYELTCNGDGKWEDGEEIIGEVKCTKGPAVDPCKTCTMETGDILVYGKGQAPGAQKMTDDKIVTTGACAVRTFTCTGKDAQIDIEVSDPPSPWDVEIGDGTTATLSLTCNADGTGWEHDRLDGMTMDVTAVACVYTPPCKDCKVEWITELGGPRTETVYDPETRCATRTFKCLGATMQMVISTAAAELKRVAGDVEYAVACNEAGNAWMDGANAITKVECVPVGKTCLDCEAMIDLDASPNTPGAKEIESEEYDDTGACRIWKLKCIGLLAGFELFAEGQRVGEVNAPVDDPLEIVLELKCNADGTAWTFMDDPRPITGVQCASVP